MSVRVYNLFDAIRFDLIHFLDKINKTEISCSPLHAHFGNFMKMIAELSLPINLVGLVCKIVIYIGGAAGWSCR